MLVARIRLLLTAILLLIPLASLWYEQETWENLVGLAVTLTAFLVALLWFWLVQQGMYRHYLGLASSLLDVTLVSLALFVFILLARPHTAVNSKVTFEAYFLAIAATCLRYDVRICMMAGLCAMGQYALIVTSASAMWDLNSPQFAPFPYGVFNWSVQVSRLILMLTATVLSTTVVFRVQRLLRLSTCDRMTGLFNRGYFDERVLAEVSRASRYHRPLTLVMMDIDHFKTFNDSHGHTAGDEALRILASVMRASFRHSDITARYGGEEFVVILPETEMAMAAEKVEKLRQSIESTRIHIPKQGVAERLTISAGLSCFPEDGTAAAQLLDAADRRLFAAKRLGRNRVVSKEGVLAS
ncbi:MAG: GGDEF domain-containing protein [Acidobacteria bacterium]|nr:GGDEF domain-containing protein [Acidobacteriota bacterium]MCI0626988.1 GGDEF domain-containing protein [Acidobacteriota bacterium]MCI0720661.1 GGDEF domain-containing protein [Acidobacteriota bacterium]